ncbi:MAG: serine hydrolase, partial [Thermomicrobiales bacterium]|nr:serine hydrolase [Thermomicrobiales bacterium]
SLDDMLRFARFQLGNGMAGSRSLLGVETLRRTRSPLGPGGTVPGEGEIIIDNIGVAWMIWQRDGARIVSHSGGTNGQMSTFVFVPERDFAMSLLTNAMSGILLAFELTDWTLERVLGLRRSPLEVISATKAPISEYAGGYALPDGSLAIDVGEASDGFQITWETPDRPAGTSPLQVVGVDLVTMRYMGADLLADFVRDGDGEIAWIRFLGRLVPRAA